MFRLGTLLGIVGRAIPPLARELVGLAGAGAIAYGAWLVYEPAGFIVGGVLAVAGAALHGYASGRAGAA